MMYECAMKAAGVALMVVLAIGCGEDAAKKGHQDPGTMRDVGADLEPRDAGDLLDGTSSDTGNPVADASNPEDQGGEADGAMVDMAQDTGPRICEFAFESTLRPALHIIADYSGSMVQSFTVGGPRLYEVQNSSLTALAARISSQFRVGFVSFPGGPGCSDAVSVDVPMGQWDASDITSALRQADGGPSPSPAALRDVGDSMRFSNPNDPDAAMRERHVLMFADSIGNQCLDDGDDIMSAEQMATATGATLHAIALDPGSDLFPEEAALQTGGTHSIVGQVDTSHRSGP